MAESTVHTNGRSHVRMLKPRIKLWLEIEGRSVFCRGLRDMLHAVAETGSIKEAAAKVGRSYRFVWARIKEAEGSLGATLVKTSVGGKDSHRSTLTPLARDLIHDFDELRAEAFALMDKLFRERLHETLRRHAKAK
jgi:molybdate transport system regulatory protein